MACFSPLTGYYARDKEPSGKRRIVFSLGAAFSGVPLRIPCGQCTGCRLERSRQWAMRCMHEAKLHDFNEFVTLTYSDAKLPFGATLVKRDLQLFMKRLRKELGNGIRFYGCGEYGDRTHRPHYHVLLFNCRFTDKRFYKDASCGSKLYTSKILDDIWSNGFCIIGDVTFDSAAYVARYIMKKVTGERADDHYDIVSPDGEIIRREPEFTNMSRKPGIGAKWFELYGEHAYKFDSVIVNGMEVRPPRFYDGRFELVNAAEMENIKRKRALRAMKGLKDNKPDRLRVRETVSNARLALKGRTL